MPPVPLKPAGILAAIATLLFFAIAPLRAQVLPALDALRVAGGFNLPLFITAPPGDTNRLFIVERTGLIRIIDLKTGTVNSTPFLDLSGSVILGGEAGLLGLAFDPNYARNGRFYVDYVGPGGAFDQGITHIALFRVSSNPDVADARSERTVLAFDQPHNNHNGGWIGFSPRRGDEGNLYIASGDGGGMGNDAGPGHIEPGGNAQNTTTLLGKMLRIHLNNQPLGTYSIPDDNPFAGSATDKEEIWQFGLRNPFRNSFDRQSGMLFVADVGQDSREEIDVQPASNKGGGENYGWRVREGSIQNPAYPDDPIPPGAVGPAYDYPHSVGQAVIGGYIYRGSQIKALRGTYVFADYLGPDSGDFTGRIFTLNFSGTTAYNFQDITADLFPTGIGNFPLLNPASLGEDANGELYIADLTGNIFQIVRQGR